ncbi:DoxX family protein [Candidatus Uhrbacteria bacterium]|nr:DoxX family protein [Candidatus Uhrbacteria bacterium]
MYFFNELSGYYDSALLALRVAVGASFLAHGLMKRGMWRMQPSAEMPVGMLNMMRFLSIVEPLGALAVLAGFLTQYAAIGFGLIMLGAIYFKTQKWGKTFAGDGGWELDLLLLASAIVLLLGGAGNVSIDARLLQI